MTDLLLEFDESGIDDGDESIAAEILAELPLRDFLRLELGLHFLAEYFPDEPIGVLPPIMSGYLAVRDDLKPVVRKLRLLMDKMGRTAYWRHHLGQYARIRPDVRAFERTDDVTKILTDQTTFASKPTAYSPSRIDEYRKALASPVPYAMKQVFPPAEPGREYRFLSAEGGERVLLPPHLPVAGAPAAKLEPVAERTRDLLTISWSRDLHPTADWIDGELKGVPEVSNRDWAGRLAKIRFKLVDEEAGELVSGADEFCIEGTVSIPGLTNSGKTTLFDVLAVNRVKDHGERVAFVVPATADSFAKVSLFGYLGFRVVPIIGQGNRGEHVARYWNSVFQNKQVLFPGSGRPDPAAKYASATCLLEPFRSGHEREWKPLDPKDFPCRGGKLRGVSDGKPHDCPLVDVCPFQKAAQDSAEANVWVTTSAALIATNATESNVRIKEAEQFQHHADLMVVDEADKVYHDLDERFTQTEPLVGAGGHGSGWTAKAVAETAEALGEKSMGPLDDDQVAKWTDLLKIHDLAVHRLYRLLMKEEHEEFRASVERSPFNGHRLLRRAALMLLGIDEDEDDKALADQADDFYNTHLQALANEPLKRSLPAALRGVVAAMTDELSEPDWVADAIDAWIESIRHLLPTDAQFDMHQLRLTMQAGIWAGRITTTFFELSTMYPSIREKLDLPDDDSFWLGRPPRDYQPFVPEAPMGNMLALLWKSSARGGGYLQIVWVHGVGRWLLHHLHDLLEHEGIAGPHVILTSATHWSPGSSMFHIPIRPIAVLEPDDKATEALATSKAAIELAKRQNGFGIFNSGVNPERRDKNLTEMIASLTTPRPGKAASQLRQLLNTLDEDRRKLLLVTQSGRQAKLVTDHLNTATDLVARNLVSDQATPGKSGVQRRKVPEFGLSNADVLVASELGIERGYNILNSKNTAALGAVVFMVRSQPPPDDLAFPLSLVYERAMKRLLAPVDPVGAVYEAAREIRHQARADWFGIIGQNLYFRAITKRDFRTAFASNRLNPVTQTVGRTIRGNAPTIVWFTDAAFAPRFADPTESAADNVRTSLIRAMTAYLDELLTEPEATAHSERIEYEINKAVWGLSHHLLHSIDWNRP